MPDWEYITVTIISKSLEVYRVNGKPYSSEKNGHTACDILDYLYDGGWEEVTRFANDDFLQTIVARRPK